MHDAECQMANSKDKVLEHDWVESLVTHKIPLGRSFSLGNHHWRKNHGQAKFSWHEHRSMHDPDGKMANFEDTRFWNMTGLNHLGPTRSHWAGHSLCDVTIGAKIMAKPNEDSMSTLPCVTLRAKWPTLRTQGFGT